MKLSLSTASLYVYPLRWTLAIAKRAGFDGIELVISPESEVRGGSYVKTLAAEFGLVIYSVHPPLFEYPGWNHVHDSVAPYMDRALAAASEVGAPVVVVHMPKARGVQDGIGREFIDRLVSERKNLNGAGLQISLENCPRFRARDAGLILTKPEDLRGFADAHDFPMTLDTSHIGTFGLNLIDAYDHFRGRLVNVHLSDLREVSPRIESQPILHSYVKQHQLPGAGNLPLREFTALLARDRYDGPITFELSPIVLSIWNPRRVEKTLKKCVEYVRAAWWFEAPTAA